MLNRIIEFSVRNKLIVALFIIALVIYGAFQVTRLPVDAVPDITNNQVQVITVAPSFGATDIERLVTFPVEQATTNIPGLKEMRSFSRFGLSLVTIVFDESTDIYWARQQVAERLQQVQASIPPGIGRPELGPVSTGLGEIYQYVVRPAQGYKEKYDATELRTIQDWIVRRQLLGVEGVAEVSSFGGRLKQYEVAVDPARLQSHGITISDVFSALEKNNQNTGGAYLEEQSTALFIRSEGLVGTLDDIGNIPVRSLADGTPLLIKDVANVRFGSATRYGAMCYNDEGEVAGAVVMMLKGANSSKVIKAVKAKVQEIRKTLPEGVIIEPFLDRTKMVDHAIGTVERNLMEGALIVVLVLVMFLGNIRAGLLVASVIPLSMLFAVIMMNLFGVSGNLMSLGALDFGLIVDGAVIIVEAVMHQLSHSNRFARVMRLEQPQMDEQVIQSAGKMMNSAVFGQVIILVVYLPIFTLQGIEGKMFRPMAQTVAFALIGAFLLSLTYIPMMSAVFISKKISHKPGLSDRLMQRIEHVYKHYLLKLLHYPKTVLTVIACMFVLAVVLLTRMGGEFIPALEEGDFAVETRVLTGSNLATSIERTQKAAHILTTRFPEVEKVVTKIGSGEVPTDPMPMEAADMMVILKDKEKWTSAKTFNELAEKMGHALQEVPGITTGFQYPVQMRFNELMTGARQDVVCKIFGENLDTLSKFASQLGNIVSGIKGAENVYVEPVTGLSQIVVRYNRPAIAQYGLSVEDVNKVINSAFAGEISGQVYEDEKRFDIAVRLEGTRRQHPEDVQNLLIPTSGGTQVPLYQVADVKVENGPNQVQREQAHRRIVVGFNVRGRDVQSIVEELQQKAGQSLQLPAGYYVSYGGAFENLNAAKQRLSIAVPVSLVMIFLLLFFAFGSVKQGLLIYTAIPLSAIGGIYLLAARGMPFSISAGVGFIALFGVAVLNGIVLITEFNRLKQSGIRNIYRVVVAGTGMRLRPVLMTAFVASLGFFPMAVSNGAGAEVQRPLATVVMGGLIIATFLTLFVLPVLYIIFEKRLAMKKQLAATAIVLLLVFAADKTQAQVYIDIAPAIDTALHNNLSVKAENVMAGYQRKLTGTALDIPQTMITGEAGQINSAYTDTRVGISQSLAFPLVYARQRTLLTESWKTAVQRVHLKEEETKKLVRQVFYYYLYLEQKQRLLQQTDSMYAGFLEKASLRLKAGEANVLEQTTAEVQRGQTAMQLAQLQQDMDMALADFRMLLHTSVPLVPAAENYKMPLPDMNADLQQNAEAKILAQQQREAAAAVVAERAKLLPELNVSYFNMSMKGTGADDVVYTGSERFNSVQLGIGLPVFTAGQRARIAASKLNSQAAAIQYDAGMERLQTRYEVLLSGMKKNSDAVKYYETTALYNAAVIVSTATRQFAAGDISYLEWVTLTNQAIIIRSNYLDAVRALNDNLIEINYLLSK